MSLIKYMDALGIFEYSFEIMKTHSSYLSFVSGTDTKNLNDFLFNPG